MEIRGLTVAQVEQAAKRAHVRAHYPTLVRHTREGLPVVRVTLKTDKDKDGAVVYGRTGRVNENTGESRRLPGSVCWHGHREFMRAVYRIKRDAVIVTALARYNNSEHFEGVHEETRTRPGYRMGVPLEVAALPCDCSVV